MSKGVEEAQTADWGGSRTCQLKRDQRKERGDRGEKKVHRGENGGCVEMNLNYARPEGSDRRD